MKARGATIVELVVVIAIGSLAMLITTQTTLMAQKTIETGIVEADTEARTGALLEQIANEVKDSGARFAQWSPSNSTPSTTLTFSRCSGFISVVGQAPQPRFSHRVTYSTAMNGTRLCLNRSETCLEPVGTACPLGCDNAIRNVPQNMVVTTNLTTAWRSVNGPGYAATYTGDPNGFQGIRFQYLNTQSQLRIFLAQDWRADTDERVDTNGTTGTADDDIRERYTTVFETTVSLKMD